MKYGIKFTRPDTKPTIIVIELVIICMNRRELLYQEQLLIDYIYKAGAALNIKFELGHKI